MNEHVCTCRVCEPEMFARAKAEAISYSMTDLYGDGVLRRHICSTCFPSGRDRTDARPCETVRRTA